MKSVIDYLDATSAAYPDAVAVSDGTHELTFSALRRAARGLASYLAARGVHGEAIGVYAQRRAAVIAAMLGCAASGNAYVPLNPDAPVEAGVRLILGFADGEYDGAAEGSIYIRLDGNGSPLSAAAPDTAPDTAAVVDISPADTLYIIYTSGSTGEPKGIRKSHGAVMDFIEAYVTELTRRSWATRPRSASTPRPRISI